MTAILGLLGVNGVLAVAAGILALIFGAKYTYTKHKAASADAWKARAEAVERENAAMAEQAEGLRRIDAETNAGLAELAREAAAKKARIDQGRTADASAEGLRGMFGPGSNP